MPNEIEYYVLNDKMAHPAGFRIYKDKDGNRRIKMKPNQARYWIDQNAISASPPAPKR